MAAFKWVLQKNYIGNRTCPPRSAIELFEGRKEAAELSKVPSSRAPALSLKFLKSTSTIWSTHSFLQRPRKLYMFNIKTVLQTPASFGDESRVTHLCHCQESQLWGQKGAAEMCRTPKAIELGSCTVWATGRCGHPALGAGHDKLLTLGNEREHQRPRLDTCSTPAAGEQRLYNAAKPLFSTGCTARKEAAEQSGPKEKTNS